MIWLIIPLALLAVVFSLLLTSVKISLEIADKVCFSVSYLGVELYSFDSTKDKLLPQKKKSKLKTERSKKHGKPKKESRGIKDVLKDYASSKENKLELVLEVLEILQLLCIKFSALMGHIRFKKVVMKLVVASDDAAETAILYGKVCAVVLAIINYLDKAIYFSPKNLSVTTDFSSTNFKFYLSGIIKLRIVFILTFLVSTAISLFKLKIGDIKNGTAK